MSHSFSQNHIHLIFSTKDRANSIPKEFLPRIWAYLGGICNNHQIAVLAATGTENHVHLLFHLPPKMSLAEAVNLVKANSSKWMSEQGPPFRWQEGYGAFSVSFSALDATVQYIRTQEAHHRKISFEDEFRAILEKHRVAYDPKYLFG